MKRISFLVLFFYCCSFVNPPQSRAVAPLAVLAPAAIGAAVVAIAGTQYALKGDHSASSYQFDGRNITVPLVAFKKFSTSVGETILGKSVTAVLDAKAAFDDNIFSAYSSLSALVGDYFSYDPVADIPIGSVLNSNLGRYQIIGPGTLRATDNLSSIPGYDGSGFSAGGGWVVGSVYIQLLSTFKYPSGANGWYYKIYDVQPTTDDANYPPPGLPDSLPPSEVPGLSGHIANAIPIRPDIKNDVDNLLKDHPEYWPISGNVGALPEPNNDISDYPPAQPITNSDLNTWARGQSGGAQQAYIDTLQDLVDANPTDANLAAELAKAQAAQAQQEAEDVQDSFDAIHSSPFETPYTPGQFDIPARFSSFLTSVQGSGLFSFSSGFFNSVPGGGSPVYTVEAGQYGTHTVDLSETLGTGLAVLKTVLLLLFGFLSIRVVILKR